MAESVPNARELLKDALDVIIDRVMVTDATEGMVVVLMQGVEIARLHLELFPENLLEIRQRRQVPLDDVPPGERGDSNG